MDLLQRIQRWYTINCNGDWEHSYGVSVWHGISVQTLDNPGWIVSIDLKDTCLITNAMPYVLHERSTTNWFGYKVENEKFECVGGPENLSEMLEYFLDTFLPSHLNPNCTIEIGLPVIGYEGRLWLNAEGKMVSDSILEITAIEDYNSTGNYLWSNNETLEALNQPDSILQDLRVDFAIGDRVEPVVFQADDNMLRTFLVAPAKK